MALTSRLLRWTCWGSWWSPACCSGWPSAGSLCSLQSGTDTCRAERLYTAWTPDEKCCFTVLLKNENGINVIYVTASLGTTHHHLLVESIVQHQTVGQGQTVGLHGVASTWQTRHSSDQKMDLQKSLFPHFFFYFLNYTVVTSGTPQQRGHYSYPNLISLREVCMFSPCLCRFHPGTPVLLKSYNMHV